jgi:hypothetical protein
MILWTSSKSGHRRRDDLTIVSFRHVVREIKRGGSQSNCKELFPGRKKEWGSHCEKSTKKNEWHTKTKQTKMERCTNRVCVQQNLIVGFQILKWNLSEKKCIKSWSAWGVHCRLGDEPKTWAKERATGTVYIPVHVKERLYSEQYQRYKLSWGHHCGWAVSGTAVRTALVYYCIQSG